MDKLSCYDQQRCIRQRKMFQAITSFQRHIKENTVKSISEHTILTRRVLYCSTGKIYTTNKVIYYYILLIYYKKVT